MNLCAEVAAARREAGLSQGALALRLGITRETIARLEGGVGSVGLLVKVVAEIPVRFKGIARGSTIVDQMRNARERRKWSVSELAAKAKLDVRTVIAVERGQGSIASLCAILLCVAPRAKRQEETRVYWGYDRARMNAADSRFTPVEFIDAIEGAFGPVELDPCNHPLAPIRATRKIALPDCGLAADWSTDGLLFANPPFSHLSQWLKKANDEWATGAVSKLLFLMPASRLDIREYFTRASRTATTLILSERLRFGTFERPNGAYPSPFTLALVCWGCTSEEIDTFREHYPALILPSQV